MATATELISNKGDANLGFGSNPRIPVGTNTDLESITRIGDNIMYYNMQQNKALYDQKVKERDELLANISSGDIKVGDLLEVDTPFVKEGLDDLDVKWRDWITKGKNDIPAQMEYKKALREVQDRVTQAQMRKVTFDDQTVATSKETLPRKQKAMQEHLNKWLKGGFWADPTPYQQTQDLDIPGSILSTAKIITTPWTNPKTFEKGTRSEFDYDGTLSANKDNFYNDVNKRWDQQQLMNAIQGLPDDQFAEQITAMNNRIDEYNAVRGFTDPNLPGYVKQVQLGQDQNTGKYYIKERLPDFAAKYTLSSQKPFDALTSEFDKDRAANEVAKQNAAANMLRAQAALKRANAYAGYTTARTNKLTQEEKEIKGFWDGVVNRVKEHEMFQGTQSVGKRDVLFIGDLPEGYTYMSGVDRDGKPVKLQPIKGAHGTLYYDIRYNSGSTGEEVGRDQMQKWYDEYKEAGGTESYRALIRRMVKEGKLDMEVIGKNGTGDYNSALQGARSKQAGSKEPVYGETGTTVTTDQTTVEEEQP